MSKTQEMGDLSFADAIYMAKIAEQAERYDDMVKFVNLAAKHATEGTGSPFSVEDRNLLSVAYKNHVGARRAAWRVLTSIRDKEGERGRERNMERVAGYRTKVQSELEDICNEALRVLEGLLQTEEGKSDNEAYVFYKKMQGDYHRYLAECADGATKDKAAAAARDEYAAAHARATGSLESTNPIRLGLALNFSVFYYEILENPSEACKLAKEAFDEAVGELDDLTEESYKDATLIMQLLRDNLTLWTSESGPDAGVEVDGTEVQDA